MINKKIFVSGVLSLVLLLFLFNNLSFSDLQQVYSNLSVKIIFIGFFLYGLTYVFRSIRLNYLIKKNMYRAEVKITLHNWRKQFQMCILGAGCKITSKAKFNFFFTVPQAPFEKKVDFILACEATLNSLFFRFYPTTL